MKIVRSICAGLDVHKRIVVATIIFSNDHGVSTYKTKSFSTSNSSLNQMKEWLIDKNCLDVCMESTGKYWIPIYNILEDKLTITLAHPKYVKAIKGKKTDKKDSKWIADLYKHDLVPGSFIPYKFFRELREISRYRMKLVFMRSSEKNRIQNAMTVSNISLANIVTDPFGKTATSIMEAMLNDDSLSKEDITKLARKHLKATPEQLYDSIDGASISSDQHFKLKCAYKHIRDLNKMITLCELEMKNRFEPISSYIFLLKTVPGVSDLSAMIILSEITTDMNQFKSVKHLTSWAGVTPTNNESAGKKKSVRISKAGQWLKPILVQVALSAIKNTKNTYFSIKYLKLKKRRGHKKAIIAIARMILTSIYYIIQTGEAFNPYDYQDFLNPKPQTQNLSVEHAIQFLSSAGYDTSNLIKLGTV